MNQDRKNILDLVDTHAEKARMSEYDRGVCILAISTARKHILALPSDLPEETFNIQVLEELSTLHKHYHDPDGQYTSGKGVIGSLLDDIRSSLQ